MFGIGGFELFIILIFGFLIFGPDKLPEIAKTVGRGIARFRSAQEEMNETLGGEKLFDPSNPDEPFKNPVEVIDKLAQRQDEKKAKAGASKQASERSGVMSGSGTVKESAPKTEGGQASSAGDAQAAGGEDADGSRPLSFTERKAQYERERAARREAEAKDLNKESRATEAPSNEAAPDEVASPDEAARREGGDA